MPEYPEIAARAREMDAELTGRAIAGIEVLQPKCLNVPEERFVTALTGARLLGTRPRGKWLITETSQGWLLLNMGMGGELLLLDRARLPEKRRLIFDFADGLRPSLAKGGAFYEVSLLGQKGGFIMEDVLIGYKEGQPCPACGAIIEKIKTGSTSSFICPNCQPAP